MKREKEENELDVGYCKTCKKYNSCTKICSKVEKDLKRLRGTQKEFIPQFKSMNYSHHTEEELKLPELKVRNSYHLKLLIVELYKEGKSMREIAYHLPCTFQYASQVIIQYKEAIRAGKVFRC